MALSRASKLDRAASRPPSPYIILDLDETTHTLITTSWHRSDVQQAWSGSARLATESCALCGEIGERPKRCRCCPDARYCSRRCQVVHWVLSHKPRCGFCPLVPQPLPPEERWRSSAYASTVSLFAPPLVLAYEKTLTPPWLHEDRAFRAKDLHVETLRYEPPVDLSLTLLELYFRLQLLSALCTRVHRDC